MFIHWGGIYSVLGGVWEGKHIDKGLSEQIQSHAGIYSDSYAAVARHFNPEKWNADSIAALAVRAGMKAIVFTSKHHDGFCMWDTKTTNFNVVKATPFKRDVVKELADACKRRGLKFGLYFSNIDWHFPEASPISSHNSDSIPPLHHAYNMAQIKELLTNYGEITELWFDMGSNTLQQSKEMRELVHRLQPHCMIGSRLGNDMGDFTVMSDNQQPDYEIGVPWQSPASFFDETWGYRSWQQHVPKEEKFREKLTSLIKVAARGGKYLLNIGPKGDGSVVSYERDILIQIGDWLAINHEAIYGTAPDPFREDFPWGAVTATDKEIYLILTAKPEGNRITLPRITGKVAEIDVLGSPNIRLKTAVIGNELQVHLPATFNWSDGFKVIALRFKEAYTITPSRLIQIANQQVVLNHSNAFHYFSNSGIDYNSRFKSTVKESWNLLAAASQKYRPVLWYSDQEKGKKIDMQINDVPLTVSLDQGQEMALNNEQANIKWESPYISEPFWSGIDEFTQEVNLEANERNYRKVTTSNEFIALRVPMERRQAFVYAQTIISQEAAKVLIKVTSGDGISLALNGNTLLLHNNPERGGTKTDYVLLPLHKGENRLLVKTNNLFGDAAVLKVERDIPQRVYCKKLADMSLKKGQVTTISWKLHAPTTIHETMNMPNLALAIK
ncbi:hypothetical protein GCM10023231_00840 [Olivibacter ginsenosidimutans]|uniref:alpha-L-fucosidase n=2 Tax=Olivibacter ginsenosidimutans TaxID=1176537 RepID=A0ABP9ADZ3_9SPHI